MKTKDMVLTGVFAAVICVFAPFTIPIGAVPISLATFAVYLAAAVLGTKKGTLAVLIYILIGMAGVPVFSGFAGGIGKILGVTGGYIIGYIPCAFAIGVFTERFGGKNGLWYSRGTDLCSRLRYAYSPSLSEMQLRLRQRQLLL